MQEKLNTQKLKYFTDLIAWKEGHKLVLMIYKETELFPKEEKYGIVNQIRRASVSITSNLAEGFSRQSYKEKSQFYSISLGSVTELQNQLIISRDLKYVSNDIFNSIIDQSIIVHKITNALIKSSKGKFS